MKKYFIDETETFAINTPLDARVELMGWEKIPIVYVDNFYKNPNMVRNLAIRCPGTNNPRVCGGVPGVRVDMNMNLDHMWSIWMEIADSVWGVTKKERKNFEIACMQVPFSVNVTQSNFRRRLPHIDVPEPTDRGWAGVVYLNKGKECKGGTGFYTYKGMQVNPYQEGIWGNKESDWQNEDEKDNYITDSQGPWELIHLAKMKYNRMVMYPSNILHGAYDKPEFFQEDIFRLVQSFFIPVADPV